MSEPVPPTILGLSPTRLAAQTGAAATDDEGGTEGGADTGEGQNNNQQMVVKKQTTIRNRIDNAAQKKLGIAWAEAMFRADIAFNFLNFDTTQARHDAYLEVANARPKVKLPTYKHMRMMMLDCMYLKVEKAVNPMTVCWDKTGCTFITDGSTDRKNRPVMNFLAAGEKGAVLVTTVHMTGRKKNAAALAKLWEQMLQRVLNREHVLAEMVDEKFAARWRSLRWLGKKLQRKADLVYFKLRSETWWAEVKKIVAIIEPAYSLPKRMDKELVRPTNLVEFNDMIARKLSNIVLTKTERKDVMAKVTDRVQMMRQPAQTTAFLLDPRRRDPGWLNDPHSALVRNAMRFLMRQIGHEWNSKKHVDMWDQLWEFLREPVEGKVRKDENMCTDRAREGATKRAPQDWWGLYGGDVRDLQKIAMRVLGMWSTTTPAERNWASMDFVHSKRRNNLSPESLEKLVYIHWNMQLLRVPDSKESGYIDMWGSFFEPLMEPTPEEQSVEEGTMDKIAYSVDEEKRQRRLANAPKGHVPKGLAVDDSTRSSDFEDFIGKGKCWNESTSDESEDEDDIGEDSDFELGAKPAVPATTYVSRMLGKRKKEAEELLSKLVMRVDTDIEFLTHTVSDAVNPASDAHDPPLDADEEEAARAKAVADKDVALVQKHMQEEEARRAVVPTRRERQRQTTQVEKQRTHHVIDNVEKEADAHARHKGCS
ncbi:hypothetical protein CBR_g40724 [Chara braunii]|uniref:HAT C-terminal dimerisation domain-containing protein n=1 Tax=Chara braunii TaxID=69332 RepID=A0A388LUM1_CHABU|nr:hypothetical protein CBR_g40724 [Chara braunii]|eukprot:GBG85912.1 hypothetical protein CBR_g40724 [Chara braunii]